MPYKFWTITIGKQPLLFNGISRRFTTPKEAEIEAEKASQANPGKRVYLMEAVKSFITQVLPVEKEDLEIAPPKESQESLID